ncbi:MAG: SMC-Scp complex subunit ScpB [Clostridiales bacterium]|nr:SMC-Scp complex subunit ScpB [Clostridiales bacterium]
MQDIKSIIEAVIFASGEPVEKREFLNRFQGLSEEELDLAVLELKEKYDRLDSGIVLLDFNGKLQFSTNPKIGETVAEFLTPLKEKSLTKTLLEVLATIAYKQPVTRLEIDELRGVNSDYAIAALTKAGLITIVGRKDTVGRPLLYGTTDEFLKKFQLSSIKDLPDISEVVEQIELIYSQKSSDTLYHNRSLLNDLELSEKGGEKSIVNALKSMDTELEQLVAADVYEEETEDEDFPEFLRGENYKVYE